MSMHGRSRETRDPRIPMTKYRDRHIGLSPSRETLPRARGVWLIDLDRWGCQHRTTGARLCEESQGFHLPIVPQHTRRSEGGRENHLNSAQASHVGKLGTLPSLELQRDCTPYRTNAKLRKFGKHPSLVCTNARLRTQNVVRSVSPKQQKLPGIIRPLSASSIVSPQKKYCGTTLHSLACVSSVAPR